MVIYVIAINLHRGCGGLDCMVIGFITTCAIIAYHFSVISRRSVLLVEETGENHQPVASY
jgi:hypothetical protein